MAHILGLDIGERSVRGALVKTTLRRVDLLQIVEVEIAQAPPAPESPAHPGVPSAQAVQESLPAAITPAEDAAPAPPQGETDPAGDGLGADPLRDAVQRLMASLEQTPDRVVTSLDGREASLRVLEIPQGAAKRISEVLPYELENLLPFELEDAVIDHQPIDAIGGQLQVLACAVPRERVAEHLRKMQELGVDPRELAVGAAALDGLVPLLPALSEAGPMLLMEIGARVTDLCLLCDGHTERARTLSVGIAQVADGSLEAAVRRTLTTFRASGAAPPSTAFLLGEAASDPNAVEWLSGRFGFDVRALPLPPTPGAEGQALGCFGRAAALGGRLAGHGKRIDLRRGQFASQQAMGLIRKQGRLFVACAATVLAALLFATWARWATLDDERTLLRAELERVTEDAFDHGTTHPQRARRLLTRGTRTDDPLPRFDAYDVLAAVSAAVPDDVVHSTRRLHIELDDDGNGGRFEIQGIVATVADRDRIAQQLSDNECIQEIENGRTHPGPGGEGLNYQLEGTVRCPGAPEPEGRRRHRRRRRR